MKKGSFESVLFEYSDEKVEHLIKLKYLSEVFVYYLSKYT